LSEIMSALSERLSDSVWTVRWNAARAVAQIPHRADPAATLLACQPPPATSG
jgi:HEAT repeat protein